MWNEGPAAADGTREGDRIEGSRFVRAFCCECQQPMRVQTLNGRRWCDDCDSWGPRSKNWLMIRDDDSEDGDDAEEMLDEALEAANAAWWEGDGGPDAHEQEYGW